MNNNGENQNITSEPILTPVSPNQTNNGSLQSVSVPSQNVQMSTSDVTNMPVSQSAPPSQTTSNVVGSATLGNGNPFSNTNTQQQNIPVSVDLNTSQKDSYDGGSYQASSTNLNSSDNILSSGDNSAPSIDNMQLSGDSEPVVIKKKSKIVPFLLLVILGLGGYLLFTTKDYRNKVEKMKYNCTPITSYKEAKEIDINSTIVQDLYSKVRTSIREDVAQPIWDDNMKLYLAYRQITEHDKYDSNCNMYDSSRMEPYYCVESSSFTPKAFKASLLQLELKKLFGEENNIQLNDIKLTNSCIGGFQYIPERGEYVEGVCDKQTATSFKVDKQLSKAITYRNTIVLTENVKYHANEKMNLPDYLKNGEYIYTFRLDMNYNYVLISKIYNDKYS